MIWNRKYLLGATAAVGAIGGVTAITLQGHPKFIGESHDLMSLLNARSPGARTGGAVTTKGPRVAMARTSRVLPLTQAPIARQSTVLPAGVPAAPFAAAPLAALAPTPAASVPLLATAPSLAAAPVIGSGIGAAALLPLPLAAVLIAPGGGGGGGGGFIAAPDTAPAIPEPATWLMMIVGFGLLGAWLRRRRRFELTAGIGRTPGLVAS